MDDQMSDVLLDAATGQECKAIPVVDYDFAVECLNTVRIWLVGMPSSEANTWARTEIEWALLALGEDIPK
jgi:hypothetical protein